MNSGAPVIKLQFAEGSRWESCVVLERGGTTRALSAMLENFHACEIGVEAFYREPAFKGDGLAFVGFRLPLAEETIRAVSRCANGFLERGAFSVGDCVGLFEKELRLPLFRAAPSFLELGLVNQWKSYGGLLFWKEGAGEPLSSLNEALAGCERFRGELASPPAIEAGRENPLPHWAGFPAAEEGASCGKFRLARRERLADIISAAFTARTDL
ncbi:MAG: hypothetical protein RR501_00385 [Cloacibacillus sp.]